MIFLTKNCNPLTKTSYGKIIKMHPCSDGPRKISVGGPKQFSFGKYIKWEGRNKKFSENTHKIANNTLMGLDLRGRDPLRSSHSSAPTSL